MNFPPISSYSFPLLFITHSVPVGPLETFKKGPFFYNKF